MITHVIELNTWPVLLTVVVCSTDSPLLLILAVVVRPVERNIRSGRQMEVYESPANRTVSSSPARRRSLHRSLKVNGTVIWRINQ